jgi:hypothetical protein
MPAIPSSPADAFGPGRPASATWRAARSNGDDVLRRDRHFRIAGHRQQLRLASLLEAIDVAERLTDRLADRQQAMDCARSSLHCRRGFSASRFCSSRSTDHALEIMIRNTRPAHRGLRERQQSAFEGGHRHAGIGVSMQDTGHVGTRGVMALWIT